MAQYSIRHLAVRSCSLIADKCGLTATIAWGGAWQAEGPLACCASVKDWMELTEEHYRVAKIAYGGYVKQAYDGYSVAIATAGHKLPEFDDLTQSMKDAWAAAIIAVLLDHDRRGRRALGIN